MALGCFLLLPVLRAITAPRQTADLVVREVPNIEKPPEMKKEEPEEEKKEPPPPPKPAAEAPPMDLSQMELALTGAGFGDGSGAGAFALPLAGLGGGAGDGMDELFDFGGLEEQPRVLYRARPKVTRAMRKRMPCTVHVLMTVDERGRVLNPTVERSDDPMFNGPALEALRNWKFEAGKRNGEPDSFRVRQPITFK
ncbi:MAG: energy transducer TonB [Planctomycetota bacterium]